MKNRHTGSGKTTVISLVIIVGLSVLGVGTALTGSRGEITGERRDMGVSSQTEAKDKMNSDVVSKETIPDNVEDDGDISH